MEMVQQQQLIGNLQKINYGCDVIKDLRGKLFIHQSQNNKCSNSSNILKLYKFRPYLPISQWMQ